jgi:hypothetical protein
VASGAGLAGELTGDGQQGLPATNRDGESTEMKRRPRGSYLGARKGWRSAGGADRRRGAELRLVPSGGGAVRARKGGGAVRGVEELEGILL